MTLSSVARCRCYIYFDRSMDRTDQLVAVHRQHGSRHAHGTRSEADYILVRAAIFRAIRSINRRQLLA
eukprot:scaffold257287_cov31-Tisochrysis_lutea.AAC.1